MNGGLGDSIAQLLALKRPTPIEMVAVNDSFGESGKPSDLMEKYGLTRSDIVKSVKKSFNTQIKLDIRSTIYNYTSFIY